MRPSITGQQSCVETMRTKQDAMEVIKNSIKHESGCLLWQGYCQYDGYGMVTFNSQRIPIHRLAAYVYGIIERLSDPLDILHDPILCKFRNCIEETHLRKGTPADNAKDKSISMTHCKRGHELTSVNVYISQGGRHCKVCRNDKRKTEEYKKKKRIWERERYNRYKRARVQF